MASSRPNLTHFLCLPLVSASSRPQLSENLASFREDVTRPKSQGGFNLPPEAVRPVGTLHLTLGVMSFPQNEGLDKAVQLLKSLNLKEILADITPPGMPGVTPPAASRDSKLLITLKGLNCMRSPAKTRVLYAPPVDPQGIVQGFCENVNREFEEAGFITPEGRPLLLHATVVKTSYVKKSKGRGKGAHSTVVGDAQAIMDRYEDQVWLEEFLVEKITICKMRAKSTGVDGEGIEDAEYEVEAEVDF